MARRVPTLEAFLPLPLPQPPGHSLGCAGEVTCDLVPQGTMRLHRPYLHLPCHRLRQELGGPWQTPPGIWEQAGALRGCLGALCPERSPSTVATNLDKETPGRRVLSTSSGLHQGQRPAP